MFDATDQRIKRWKKVQAYKHDGLLHRQWSPAFLVQETEDYWALASRASLVTESDGRKWVTREKAVFLLYKKKWMNVIAMFKTEHDICYYVNIASPTILDKDYLKYIDYDLDVKLYPDGVERTLDEGEFARHVQTYGYPVPLQKIIARSAEEVKQMIAERQPPFDNELIFKLYDRFKIMNQPMKPKKEGDEQQ